MSTHALSPHITISAPTEETLPSLTRLTKTLLPINYPPKFFTALLSEPCPENAFSIGRIAVWHDEISAFASDSGLDSAATPGASIDTISGSGDQTSNANGRQHQQASHCSHPTQSQGQGQGRVHSQVIAGISGRLQQSTPLIDPSSPTGSVGETHLYIATLGVLAPWRNQGVASALLHSLISTALAFLAAHGAEFNLGPLTMVYAHVWEVNESGLEWYQGQGFETGDLMRGYYRKLRPDGAWMVKRGVLGVVTAGKRWGNGEGKGEIGDAG